MPKALIRLPRLCLFSVIFLSAQLHIFKSLELETNALCWGNKQLCMSSNYQETMAIEVCMVIDIAFR